MPRLTILFFICLFVIQTAGANTLPPKQSQSSDVKHFGPEIGSLTGFFPSAAEDTSSSPSSKAKQPLRYIAASLSAFALVFMPHVSMAVPSASPRSVNSSLYMPISFIELDFGMYCRDNSKLNIRVNYSEGTYELEVQLFGVDGVRRVKGSYTNGGEYVFTRNGITARVNPGDDYNLGSLKVYGTTATGERSLLRSTNCIKSSDMMDL